MKRKVYIALFTLLILAYLGLNLLVAPTQATLDHYHLSSAGARAIIYSVVIPIAAIYAIGVYGSLKMKAYSQLIRRSRDGRAFNLFSNGLLFIVATQIISGDVGGLFGLILRHNLTWAEPLTIISNYITIVLTVLAFLVTLMGAWRLSELVNRRRQFYDWHVLMLFFIALSAFYSYLITRPESLSSRQYFIPSWAVILTITIPYLFAWYFGFLAAYRVYVYQKNVKGLIYKDSLNFVASGIGVVVLSSIAVRFLATVAQLSRLKITPILFIIYAFLALLAIGFLLIAWGARKLRQIEEV